MGKPYDHTSLGGAGRKFPQTEWTRMLDIRQHEVVLAEMCRAYWKPVYHYLRGMGFGNEEAKDLTQGFFTEKVLGRNLVQKADRTRGRFRSFMLRSVRNYAISVQRASIPHMSFDEQREDAGLAVNPEVQFNRTWADETLQDVLAELELECQQRGKDLHWRVFHDWLLDPHIEGGRDMSKICRLYGISDRSKAYHMIENSKRRFRAILRAHLEDVVLSDADIDVEIHEFIGVFSRD